MESTEYYILKLEKHIRNDDYKGFDPYDTLNSFLNFKKMGNRAAAIAIQIQKRNPINIRPMIGVRKGYNPKGTGLLLKAYCNLYKYTKDKKYLKAAEKLFTWLTKNYSEGFSGICWGYNFDWASPNEFIPAFTPSVVVTSFVIDGIYEYYSITKSAEAANTILSAAKYISQDIPTTSFQKGICFAYTHLNVDCCYNASLLAAEVLAKADKINSSDAHRRTIESSISFVLSNQHPSGVWNYSYDIKKDSERHQVDFHQGFILVSLNNLRNLLNLHERPVIEAIEKGIYFYMNNQFTPNGRSYWRIPRKWPVEIHNQSQGIITFYKLSKYGKEFKTFGKTISTWTLRNMYSDQGYFYYRKNRFYTNRIDFLRWSNAWMMLALSEQLLEESH